MTMMKNSDKKRTPLQELRFEKAQLKRACKIKEEEMSSRLSYMYENLGSILGSALLQDIGKRFGFGGKSKHSRDSHEDPDNTPPSSSIKQTVLNGLQITYPYIKEFAQPLILGFVASKVKGLFHRDKKKLGKK